MLKKSGTALIINRIGCMDFIYAGFPFRKYCHYVRFTTKKEVFGYPVVGPVTRVCRYIPVGRINGSKSSKEACKRLENDELAGIFPELTVSRSLEVRNLRSGAARMAQCTGKSIIPMLIMGSQRV